DNASAAQQLATQRMSDIEKILGDALSAAKIVIPAPAPFFLPASESAQHTWVQVPQGPDWVDFDPTLAGARSGDILATVATTMDQIPTDPYHVVTIRVVAEEVVGGSPNRRDAATFTATSVEIGAQPITIGVTPPSGVAALGASISELGTGVVAYYPYITVGGMNAAYATTPVSVTSGDQGLAGVLGDATPATGAAEGELLGLWYAVDITSPDREPISIEREMYDRVGFANRGGATIDLTKVPPIQLATGTDGTSYAPGLSNVFAIGISSADLPSSYALASEDPFGGLSSLGSTHDAFWGSLLRGNLLSIGVQAFVDVPQVAAFTIGLADTSDPASDLLIRGDLVLNQRALIPASGGSAGSSLVHPALRTGILAQVAESVLLAPQFWSANGQVTTGATVADVFEAAAKSGTKIAVLGDSSAPVPTALPGEANLRILTALKAGLIVVVPEEPVSVGSSTWTGWWTIDPKTGATSDMMQNGMGYASIAVPGDPRVTFQDAAEEAEILTEVNKWTPWYQRLGKCLAVVALLAAAGIDPSSLNPGSFTTSAGAAKVLYRVISRNPNVAKDIASCFG
ncbi:MAG TPA: hypothetical protein VFQ54_06465, partial [Thermomicrobiales bacterium]|nr:hypothetical protein [Thermomicrobiales bacterium]